MQATSLWSDEDQTQTIAKLGKLADHMHTSVFPRPSYCGFLPDYRTAVIMLQIESQARAAIAALERLWSLPRPYDTTPTLDPDLAALDNG